MAISTYLADVWSATDFGTPELSGYAENQLRKDTRIGIQTMAGLALVVQVFIAVLAVSRGLGSSYVYTCVLVGMLSLHIIISACFVKDVGTLHALGLAFLVIGALSVTVLAHRAGDLNIGMMAAVVMLFVAVPLVPWALREATAVITLTYLLLTASLVSVPGRFDSTSLFVLQALILGAGIVVVVVTGRNTFIRKQDIRARFELENARSEMELLSMQDHLTGAWNRRFLDENFQKDAKRCAEKNEAVHVAVLDIDDFKGINDRFGHQVGDSILINVAETFMRLLGRDGRLIRLGGDEFLIVYCGNDLDAVIESAIGELQKGTVATDLVGTGVVALSAGIASAKAGELANLDSLYKSADHALYAAKGNRSPIQGASPTLTRTGTWRL